MPQFIKRDIGRWRVPVYDDGKYSHHKVEHPIVEFDTIEQLTDIIKPLTGKLELVDDGDTVVVFDGLCIGWIK